jgi:hypothetical protein
MFFFLNTNFDGSNIESPLSGFLDTKNQDKFKLGSTVVRTIPLKSNVGFLKDSYYSSSATKKFKFFGAEDSVMKFDFRADN